MVEDGYEFFAKRQLVTLFSAPNYCGEFDNAGGMMSVDETLMCSFQVRHFLTPFMPPPCFLTFSPFFLIPFFLLPHPPFFLSFFLFPFFLLSVGETLMCSVQVPHFLSPIFLVIFFLFFTFFYFSVPFLLSFPAFSLFLLLSPLCSFSCNFSSQDALKPLF